MMLRPATSGNDVLATTEPTAVTVRPRPHLDRSDALIAGILADINGQQLPESVKKRLDRIEEVTDSTETIAVPGGAPRSL